MFSYYGAKTKIVNIYSEPKYNLIIEPFAGSAKYSLKYWDRDVILVEKYEKLFMVWKYLQSASESDILCLPDIKPSSELSKNDGFNSLSNPEKWLIGFCANRGSVTPKNFAGAFCSWNKDKKRISRDLHKIKHWDIRCGDYSSIQNVEATWFIDPPYQKMGALYKEKSIDYKFLGEWCLSRIGQIIVCENDGADWLSFKNLKEISGQRKKSMEVVFELDSRFPERGGEK